MPAQPMHRVGAEVHAGRGSRRRCGGRRRRPRCSPSVVRMLHLVAGADQVAPLDQLDAHLAGEQRVLEVGGVVDARGEHDDASGRRRLGGADAAAPRAAGSGSRRPAGCGASANSSGSTWLIAAPVLDDVADTPDGDAQVVLEHAEVAGLVADQVDAGDVDAHAVRRDRCRAPARWKCALVVTTLRGTTPSAKHLAGAVDVGEERLERVHPLARRRARSPSHSLGVDDPRHEVERERPLLAGVGEGDPGVAEGLAQQVGAGGEFLAVDRLQRREQARVRRPRTRPGRRTSRPTAAPRG